MKRSAMPIYITNNIKGDQVNLKEIQIIEDLVFRLYHAEDTVRNRGFFDIADNLKGAARDLEIQLDEMKKDRTNA